MAKKVPVQSKSIEQMHKRKAKERMRRKQEAMREERRAQHEAKANSKEKSNITYSYSWGKGPKRPKPPTKEMKSWKAPILYLSRSKERKLLQYFMMGALPMDPGGGPDIHDTSNLLEGQSSAIAYNSRNAGGYNVMYDPNKYTNVNLTSYTARDGGSMGVAGSVRDLWKKLREHPAPERIKKEVKDVPIFWGNLYSGSYDYTASAADAAMNVTSHVSSWSSMGGSADPWSSAFGQRTKKSKMKAEEVDTPEERKSRGIGSKAVKRYVEGKWG